MGQTWWENNLARWSLVQVIGELWNILIRLSFDHQVHQGIKIVIVDTPKAYNVLLSRYYSGKL